MSSGVNASSAIINGDQSYENRGPVVTAVTISLLGFSAFFVILRCISRLGIVKRWSWDDSFIVLAWFLAFGFSFSICWGVRNGLGLHEQYITPSNEGPLRASEYAFSVLYNPVLMATKTSILLFFLTLSRNQPIFKWVSIATLVVVNVAGLALTLLNVLQCHPLWVAFEPVIPPSGTCMDIVTLYLSSAPVNIVTDLAILILPFPIFTQMRLPKKQKIILVITFSFGAFVAAVDVVRIAYLQEAFQIRVQEVGQANATTSSKAMFQDDFSWYASLSFMWSAIEVHVGIICACVPSLKPLVARVLPSMLLDASNSYGTSTLRHENNLHKSAITPDLSAPASPVAPLSPARAQLRAFPSDGIPGNPGSDRLELNVAANQGSQETPKDEEDDIDFIRFITVPNTGFEPAMKSPTSGTYTMTTMTTNRTERQGSVPFFDFYTMKQKKPMTKLSNRQSFAPLAAVTILFFMWGFAYGLLDVLNSQFALVTNMTDKQAVGLHAAYFGAYFVGPLTVGRYVFTKFGFRATFVCGLCIYGIGTLTFWPSAVLSSYVAFIVCNFIVGFGVSIIEVAANPFIALCGPLRHAESRLNLSQGLQAIGTVVSPLLAKWVLFKSVTDSQSLIDVQWAYLGIAFFDVALAIIFFYLPLPEASDEDFERVAEKRESVNAAVLFGNVKVIHATLAMAVVANFLYVGAQESASEIFEKYIIAVDSNSAVDPFNWQTVGHAVFAAGRFLCAGLGFLIKPRSVLMILFVGMIVSSTLAIVLTGPAGAAMIILYELFQSGVFPLIFAIALRGLGSNTKIGAVYLTAAVSGGAPFPVIVAALVDSRGVPYSFCVVVAICAFGALFPIYLTAVPKARKQVDPVSIEKGIVSPHNNEPQARPRMTWRHGKKPLSAGLTVEHLEEQDVKEK